MIKNNTAQKAMGLGFQILVTMLLFAWVGNWFDQTFLTKPYVLLAALLVGILCSLYFLIRFAKSI